MSTAVKTKQIFITKLTLTDSTLAIPKKGIAIFFGKKIFIKMETTLLDQEHLGITNLVKLDPRTFKNRSVLSS